MSSSAKPEDIEAAVLKACLYYGSTHRAYWGGWMKDIRHYAKAVTDEDAKAAIYRLAIRNLIVLEDSKGLPFSGLPQEEEAFFFKNEFSMSLTPDGRGWAQNLPTSKPGF